MLQRVLCGPVCGGGGASNARPRGDVLRPEPVAHRYENGEEDDWSFRAGTGETAFLPLSMRKELDAIEDRLSRHFEVALQHVSAKVNALEGNRLDVEVASLSRMLKALQEELQDQHRHRTEAESRQRREIDALEAQIARSSFGGARTSIGYGASKPSVSLQQLDDLRDEMKQALKHNAAELRRDLEVMKEPLLQPHAFSSAYPSFHTLESRVSQSVAEAIAHLEETYSAKSARIDSLVSQIESVRAKSDAFTFRVDSLDDKVCRIRKELEQGLATRLNPPSRTPTRTSELADAYLSEELANRDASVSGFSQKQVGGVNDEISRIWKSLAELADIVGAGGSGFAAAMAHDNPQKRVSALHERVTELESVHPRLHEGLKTVEDAIPNLQQRFKEIEKGHLDIQMESRKFARMHSELHSALQDRVRAVEGDYPELQRRLGEVESEHQKLQEGLRKVDQAHPEFQHRLKEVEKVQLHFQVEFPKFARMQSELQDRMRTMEGAYPEFQKRLGEVEHVQPELQEGLRKVERAHPEFRERLRALENSHPELQRRFVALEQSHSELEVGLGKLVRADPELQERLLALEASQPQLKQRLLELENARPELNERVKAVENRQPELISRLAAMDDIKRGLVSLTEFEGRVAAIETVHPEIHEGLRTLARVQPELQDRLKAVELAHPHLDTRLALVEKLHDDIQEPLRKLARSHPEILERLADVEQLQREAENSLQKFVDMFGALKHQVISIEGVQVNLREEMRTLSRMQPELQERLNTIEMAQLALQTRVTEIEKEDLHSDLLERMKAVESSTVDLNKRFSTVAACMRDCA